MRADGTGEMLERRLAALRGRIRLLRAERMALAAGGAALGAAVVLALLGKAHFVWVDWHWLAAAVGGAALLGWLAGLVRRVTVFQAARAAEERLALKERLSSAVALGDAPDPMVEALVADAEEHLEGRQVSAVFPRRFSREAKFFSAAALALVLALVLPELAIFQSPQERAERAALKEQGKRLVRLARRIETHPPAGKREIAQRLARNMERLGRDMAKGRVDKRRALRRLDTLTRAVKQAQDELAAESRLASSRAAESLRAAAQDLEQGRLAEAMRRLSQGDEWAQLTEAQREARAGAAAREGTAQQMLDLDEDLLKKIAALMENEDFKRAAEILQSLAEKLESKAESRELTPEEMQRLAEELERLAEALRDTDLDELAAHLREMAEALAAMDLERLEGG